MFAAVGAGASLLRPLLLQRLLQRLLLLLLLFVCCSNSSTVERLLDDITEQHEAQKEFIDALQQTANPAEDEARASLIRV